MKPIWKTTSLFLIVPLFLGFFVLSVFSESNSSVDSEKEPLIDLSGAAVARTIGAMNEMLGAFFLQRDIDDYMSYQREAAGEGASEEYKKESLEIKEELAKLLYELSNLGFISIFQEGRVYRIKPPCALVVSDIYYDESMLGKVERPPILDLMMTMICKSKKSPEPAGTLTFVLSVSPEVQDKLEAFKFTTIGGSDIELFQSKENFRSFAKDGIFINTKIKVVHSGQKKAHWDPAFMMPGKKGIFTVYGELILPGRLK